MRKLQLRNHLIVLIALGAMLAPLLGLNLGLRQSLLAVLLSFTIAAAILGAFSPLLWFLLWNVPPSASDWAQSLDTQSLILVTETLMIAFAGIVANLRLAKFLRELSGSRVIARKVLVAWLAGNLLLGSQLAWILRPFVGSPGLAVQFLRPDPFDGNFFEMLWSHFRHLV